VKSLVFFVVVVFCSQSFSKELIKVNSQYSHQETVSKISDFLKSKKLNIFTTIDHHINAEKVGLSLKPTTVLIFGNPKVGTRFMRQNQEVGLDLPMKVLIFTDENKKTYVAYRKAKKIMKRQRVKIGKKLNLKISGVFSGIEKEIGL